MISSVKVYCWHLARSWVECSWSCCSMHADVFLTIRYDSIKCGVAWVAWEQCIGECSGAKNVASIILQGYKLHRWSWRIRLQGRSIEANYLETLLTIAYLSIIGLNKSEGSKPRNISPVGYIATTYLARSGDIGRRLNDGNAICNKGFPPAWWRL